MSLSKLIASVKEQFDLTLNPVNNGNQWNKLPTTTGEFTGFLNHQQLIENNGIKYLSAVDIILFFLVFQAARPDAAHHGNHRGEGRGGSSGSP